jgi:hypothetical protein
MCGVPRFALSILSGATSVPTTLCPISARQTAVTKPTYPVPITAIFMIFSFLDKKRSEIDFSDSVDEL